MLFAIWRFIQMWLPYWVIIKIYKSKKALPANIKTRSGRKLRAIMVTDKYGLLFTSQTYIENRTKKLREQQIRINNANEALTKEMNSLSFEAREDIMNQELSNEDSSD